MRIRADAGSRRVGSGIWIVSFATFFSYLVGLLEIWRDHRAGGNELEGEKIRGSWLGKIESERKWRNTRRCLATVRMLTNESR